MSAELGNFALVTALLAAGGAVVAGVAALRFSSANALRVARGLLVLFAGLIALASFALESAFLNDEFQFRYIADYSEKALPTAYKFTAFWAGQPGSLLLWALILAVVTAAFVVQNRKRREPGHAVSLVALGILGVFISAIMVFAHYDGVPANPFALLPQVPDDGLGLNPQLQTFGMIAHPPMLFVGYVGFAIPFVILLERLASNVQDDRWLAQARPWILVAWMFLTAGIVLGAQWAYVELSYGGYWKWDPVENASLMPWLVSTALLHSVMVQRQRGSFRFWNAFLIAASFILCVFGMYLMRSDVAQSQHSFRHSSIGTMFLALLLALLAVSLGMMIWRRRLLKSDQRVEALLGKEGVFAALNGLLLIMTIIVLIGTIFPLISRNFLGREISVNERFYNTVVSPMGLVLLALMTLGPMLGYGKEAASRLPRRMLIPVLGGIAAAAGTFLFMHRTGMWQAHPITLKWTDTGLQCDLANIWALAGAAIIALGITAIVEELARAVLARVRDQGESLPIALVRLFDFGHRRYGGQLTHMGMMMILAGVIGSSLFTQSQMVELTQGQSVTVGAYSLRLDGVARAQQQNYVEFGSDVLLTDRAGRSRNLHPEIRLFNNPRNPEEPQRQSKIALSTTLTRDVYVTLAACRVDNPAAATLEVFINPLALWIWIGGGVLVLGGLLALTPPLLPSLRRVLAAAAEAQSAALRTQPDRGLTRGSGDKSKAYSGTKSGRKSGKDKSQKREKTTPWTPQTLN